MNFDSFDLLSVGIIAINCNLEIIYINRAYLNFLGKDYSEVKGQNITNVLNHTRLPEVIQSGEAEHGVWQKVPTGYLYGNRIPLYENGEKIGAMAELVLTNSLEIEELSKKLIFTKNQLKKLNSKINELEFQTNSDFIYNSYKMHEIYTLVQKIASLDTTVLLSGESGCGKEVVAKLIHSLSNRSKHPFIKLNCAAIPYDLFESELFGYERGAFTGANNMGKKGKFELADGGVLFLDEISSLPFTMQSKLLRVLQDKEIDRLGSSSSKNVDVKIVAATNEDLLQLVNEHKFRKDLYYRLNIINIEIPPLRERTEDIVTLSEFFLNKYAQSFNKPKMHLSSSAKLILENYSWPGNVRELKNAMERITIMSDTSEISFEQVSNFASISAQTMLDDTKPLNQQMEAYERRIIEHVLKKCGGSKKQAARELQINRSTLYSKLDKYNIT